VVECGRLVVVVDGRVCFIVVDSDSFESQELDESEESEDLDEKCNGNGFSVE
jgi:hypothetical protein